MRWQSIPVLLIGLAATPPGAVVAQGPRVTVVVADTTRFTGVDAVIPFVVSADVPASWRLEVTSLAGGAAVVVDSSTPASLRAELHLQPVDAERPRFSSGGYWVDVIARAASGQSTRVRYAAVFDTPPLALAPLPSREAVTLRGVERTRPPLGLSIAAGVAVAGGTILAGRAFRPSGLKSADGAESSRPVTIGITLGAATGLASRFLTGRPDREVEVSNRAAMDEYEQRRGLVESSNAFLRSSYRGLVILRREAP